MSTRLDATMNRFADSLKTRWPLEDVLAIDILAAAARRIEDRLKLPIKHEEQESNLWMRVDSFSLIQAITFLAARLQDHYEIRELRLRLAADGKMVFVDLIWSGTTVSSETLYMWELEPMNVGNETSPLTLRDVVDRHGGEIWYQRDKAAHNAYFRIVLPAAAASDAIAAEQVQQHLVALRVGAEAEQHRAGQRAVHRRITDRVEGMRARQLAERRLALHRSPCAA